MDLDKEKISNEIKSKYSVVNNSFRVVKEKNVELDKNGKPKDLINVEVGDVKDATKVFPQVKFGRWGDDAETNDANVSFRLIESEDGEESVITDKEKILWKKGNIDLEMFDVEPNDEHKEGAFKFIPYLKEKPVDNIISRWSVKAKNCKFVKQRAFTEIFQNGWNEKFQKEIVVTETQVKDLDGNVLTERPIEVINSYLIEHISKGGLNNIEEKDWKCGKIGHDYRVHLYDAEGNEAWGDLKYTKIDEETWERVVTASQDFIDKAFEKEGGFIKSNDTFGYTSEGASSIGMNTNYLRGSGYNDVVGSDGEVNSINFYPSSLYSGDYFKGVVFEQTSKTILSNGITGGQAISAGLNTVNYSTKPVISSGNHYYASIVVNGALNIKYDSGGDSGDGFLDTENSYGSPSNPTSGGFNSYRVSIYADYTPSGGGTETDDERDAKTTGVDDDDDERDAKTTGSESSNDERDAKTIGIATTNNSRPAKAHGQDAGDSNRDAKTTGAEGSDDNRDSKVTGTDTAQDNRSASVWGKNALQDNVDAKTTGVLGGNASRDAKATGIDTDNSERDAKAHGVDTDNDNISAKTTGKMSSNSNRSAKLTGIYSWKIQRNVDDGGWADLIELQIEEDAGEFTYTDDTVVYGHEYCYRVKNLSDDSNYSNIDCAKIYVDTDNNRSAKTTGKDSANDNRSAKVWGEDTTNDSRDAKVTGQQGANDSRSAKTHGQDDSQDNRSAKTHGQTSSDSYKLAKVVGKLSDNASRSAKLTGQDTTSDNRNAKVSGIQSSNSVRSAKVSGKELDLNSRNAKVSGINEDTDNRNAKTTGGLTSQANRSAKTIGAISLSSSRSAKVWGEGEDPYCPKTTPYSKKSDPYDEKTSPYAKQKNKC